jgi:HD-GYP domain-containing protein (c-di-GMP phosphodiesterase class II)
LQTKRQAVFDQHLVKVLVDIVSMFPLGSLVKLNNNEIGRVIRPVASTPPAR